VFLLQIFLSCFALPFVFTTEANIACDDTTFVSSIVSKHTTEEKWPRSTYHSIVHTACIQIVFNVVIAEHFDIVHMWALNGAYIHVFV
jgi:hypothetical protein